MKRLSCINGNFFFFFFSSFFLHNISFIWKIRNNNPLKCLLHNKIFNTLHAWKTIIQMILRHTNTYTCTYNTFAKRNYYITNNIKTFSTISEQRFKWNSVAQIAEIPNKNTNSTHIFEVMKSKKQRKQHERMVEQKKRSTAIQKLSHSRSVGVELYINVWVYVAVVVVVVVFPLHSRWHWQSYKKQYSGFNAEIIRILTMIMMVKNICYDKVIQ